MDKEFDWQDNEFPIVPVWKPGDPCGVCGSRYTYINDDRVPACYACGSTDADE